MLDNMSSQRRRYSDRSAASRHSLDLIDLPPPNYHLRQLSSMHCTFLSGIQADDCQIGGRLR